MLRGELIFRFAEADRIVKANEYKGKTSCQYVRGGRFARYSVQLSTNTTRISISSIWPLLTQDIDTVARLSLGFLSNRLFGRWSLSKAVTRPLLSRGPYQFLQRRNVERSRYRPRERCIKRSRAIGSRYIQRMLVSQSGRSTPVKLVSLFLARNA